MSEPKLIRRWDRFALWSEYQEDWDMTVQVYRNNRGDYIESKTTRRRPNIVSFIHHYDVEPELASPESNVCTIGYSHRDNKWYGWSHRAIVGFAIGDRIFEENYGDDKTLYLQHGPRVIRTHEDGRESAINFARSVS